MCRSLSRLTNTCGQAGGWREVGGVCLTKSFVCSTGWHPNPLPALSPLLPWDQDPGAPRTEGSFPESEVTRESQAGEHWGLHRAHRGPIDVLPKLPRATAKTKPGPNYSSPCLHTQCPVHRRSWRCQAPRGAWEGVVCWLEARGLGTRRLGDKMVMLSKARVLSWGMEAEAESPCDHQAGFAHRTERPRGLSGACYRKTKAAASE